MEVLSLTENFLLGNHPHITTILISSFLIFDSLLPFSETPVIPFERLARYDPYDYYDTRIGYGDYHDPNKRKKWKKLFIFLWYKLI